MNYQAILDEIHQEILSLVPCGTGATYIPQLASVSPQNFGMPVQIIDGKIFHVGHAWELFSIVSIPKVFTLTLGFTFEGDNICTRVGPEPSGSTINSFVRLEHEHGRPGNSFINAGALVISDILLSHLQNAKTSFLHYVRQRAKHAAVQDDRQVARSERLTGFRNAAMAKILKSFTNFTNEIEEVLEFYCFHCPRSMSCVDLAKGFLFLANKGHCSWTNQQVLPQSQTKRVNPIMLTFGTYMQPETSPSMSDDQGKVEWVVG
ncbi:MAG: glutaminase [Nitrospirales bacterium]|nr:glutaminase [Nitrospirales bacterium]